ncbi:MAG: hypothetical protein JWR78_3570 [Mycobacterium sp.]|jgi:hypothetical protein|nr:hypothetical protein [Mycobacterium sp.]
MRLGRPRRLGPVVLWETQRGVDLGLAERTAVMGDTVWPLGVSATARSSSGEFPGQTENGYSVEGVPRLAAHQALRLPHVAGPGPLPIPVPTRSPGQIVELPNQAGDRRISADHPRRRYRVERAPPPFRPRSAPAPPQRPTSAAPVGPAGWPSVECCVYDMPFVVAECDPRETRFFHRDRVFRPRDPLQTSTGSVDPGGDGPARVR